MDTREMVFKQLEKNLDGDSGTVIIPKKLMGNISLGEIETYLRIKGYKVPSMDFSGDEVHLHYRLEGAYT